MFYLLIEKPTIYLAMACKFNPVLSTIMIFFYMIFFNLVEVSIEKLIFGERFVHWLDPIFTGCFIAWSAYAVWICATLGRDKNK